ncbi:unnamed protein product [Tilletia caries]|uniref:GST N-terminal domain-containing protein n=1 Tax=Tilletia caries TaxID=13290 RepID=A0ABN7IQM7_9BASI|nr:unnamed protein product [Tilletia caries]CAD6912042.1 unnamed protein product [Tilletia caries]
MNRALRTSPAATWHSLLTSCVKTVVDLKLLGIKYTRERLTFLQVRNELAKKVAEDVTVPTLELPDGSYVRDSWKIAQWLAENHPQGQKIFGGSEAGKRLAIFVNSYAVLAADIAALSMPHIAPLLDEDSRDYFINKKLTKARFDQMASATPAQRSERIQQVIKNLGPMEMMLCLKPRAQATDAANASGVNWLAGGAEPTHADACLFGFYAFSRADPGACKAIWEADSLPNLGKWVRAMLEWMGPELAGDFVTA